MFFARSSKWYSFGFTSLRRDSSGVKYTSQPKMGFTRLPVSFSMASQASDSSTMPDMTPWSVTATAGMSSSAARRTMSLIWVSPSSSEYSV